MKLNNVTFTIIIPALMEYINFPWIASQQVVAIHFQYHIIILTLEQRRCLAHHRIRMRMSWITTTIMLIPIPRPSVLCVHLNQCACPVPINVMPRTQIVIAHRDYISRPNQSWWFCTLRLANALNAAGTAHNRHYQRTNRLVEKHCVECVGEEHDNGISLNALASGTLFLSFLQVVDVVVI